MIFDFVYSCVLPWDRNYSSCFLALGFALISALPKSGPQLHHDSEALWYHANELIFLKLASLFLLLTTKKTTNLYSN